MRTVTIDINPQSRDAFAAAFDRWQEAEPLLKSVSFLGDRVTARLMTLKAGDGPDRGRVVDDYPRAAALLRECIPAALVTAATVDGKDWAP